MAVNYTALGTDSTLDSWWSWGPESEGFVDECLKIRKIFNGGRVNFRDVSKACTEFSEDFCLDGWRAAELVETVSESGGSGV